LADNVNIYFIFIRLVLRKDIENAILISFYNMKMY